MAQIKKVESKAAVEKDMLFRPYSAAINHATVLASLRSCLNTTIFLLSYLDRLIQAGSRSFCPRDSRPR